MSKSDKNKKDGIVYSTNPDYVPNIFEEALSDKGKPNAGDLRIWLIRHKGDKLSTVIRGFTGKEKDLEDIGKALKIKCGCGGAVKNGEIILQGNFREKVVIELKKLGYNSKLAGG